MDTAKDWGYIRRQCFESDVGNEVANGGNYVRGIHVSHIPANPNVKVELMVALRVLREAEMEYGFKDGLYLSTALMIVEQMNGVVPEQA